MDLTAIDISNLPEGAAEPGAWAEVIGPNRSADAVAASIGTIGYEVLTGLGSRYAIEYRTDGS